MEKKNFEFKAFDSKWKEINLRVSNVFNGITKQMAEDIRVGIEIGLLEKYKDPHVRFREI